MNTTAIAMGYTPVPHEALYNIIGVSLEQGFKDLYGMKEDEIEYAMNNNSKLYSMKGEEMILLYDGIDEALKKLKDDGYSLAIVTQKNEKFTHNILSVYKHIGELFDTVCASTVEIELEKDVEVPVKYIHTCLPDRYFHWCVENTYGMPGSAWKDALTEIKGPDAA